MYIYITSQLNQGYKVGIAEDIDQRQQQYTTLIPNIGFHAAVQTGHAETIEKSFIQSCLLRIFSICFFDLEFFRSLINIFCDSNSNPDLKLILISYSANKFVGVKITIISNSFL